MHPRWPGFVAVFVWLIAAAGPRPATASPLRYESRNVSFGTSCCWSIGGAVFFGGAEASGEDTFEGLAFPYHRLEGVSRQMGRIELIAGPLLSVSVRYDDEGNPTSSLYEYGPGRLSARAPADFNGVGWTFAASLRGLTVDVWCEPTEYDECFDGWPYGEVTAALGPGLFSPEIAAALGVLRQSRGGSYWMAIDEIEGAVGDEDRVGPKNLSGLTVHAVVPEPGLALLSLVGLGMVAWRRPRRSRRDRDTSMTA